MNLVGMIGNLVGGVGLFLLGMWLMTEGMKAAAGPALERILANATRTRWRGLASGILVTSLVQSSSAVTVAAIGFVNAGLLTLGQALWVLFGANVGTTMTGWLVAAAGMGFKVEAAALPMLGAGMLLHLAAGTGRRRAVGMTLAGFGVLFLGIDVLKTGFMGAASQFALPATGGAASIALHVLAGLVLTVLMQSSSAALAVALTAAQGGLLPLSAAAAVVIGANLGTTVTAIIAAAGATINARRAAGAHVLFNLLTGAVALALLPWLLHALAAMQAMLALQSGPGTTLAMFHTVFNLLGVLLMWPLAGALTRFLEARFRIAEDDLGRPRYLDHNLAAVPELAVIALERELGRMGAMAVDQLRAAMRDHPGAELARGSVVLDSLRQAIGKFVSGLARTSMDTPTSLKLASLLRLLRYYANVAQLADAVSGAPAPEGAAEQAMARWLGQVDSLCARALDGRADGGAGLETELADAETAYQAVKAELLQSGARGALGFAPMEALLHRISLVRRGMQQTVKAARLLSRLDAPMAQLLTAETEAPCVICRATSSGNHDSG